MPHATSDEPTAILRLLKASSRNEIGFDGRLLEDLDVGLERRAGRDEAEALGTRSVQRVERQLKTQMIGNSTVNRSTMAQAWSSAWRQRGLAAPALRLVDP